jgi:hypothetical protein
MSKSDKERAAEAVSSSTIEVPERKRFDAGPGILTESGDITANAAQEQALLPKPSLSEGFGAALRLETIIDSAVKSYVNSTFDPDETFQWTPERWTEHTKNLPAEHHRHLLRARSDAHATWIADNIRQEIEDNQALTRMGGVGLALRIGTAIADPAQAVLALATGPFAASAKATRMQNVFRSGLAAGGTNAAVEGFLASNQATRDATEVFEAGLLGFVIGAPLGALTKVENKALRDFGRRGHDQSVLGRVEDAGLQITPAGQKVMADARGTPVQQANYWLNQIEQNRAAANAKTPKADYESIRANLRSAAAQNDFLARVNNAVDAPPSAVSRLDEDADFLLNKAFTFEGRKPTAMERAFARDAARQTTVAAKAAKESAEAAKRSQVDAAYAAKDAAKERQANAAYAEKDLQDAGLAPRMDPKPVVQIAAPEAKDLGRVFARGDTVWFEKGDEFISGKVETVAANGKVMVKDDNTGKVVGFHPERDDPLGEYSGIVGKGEVESTPFKRGSIGSGQIADVDVPETRTFSISLGKWEIPLRWDYFAIFMRSGNNALKRIAQISVADSVGYADKTITRGLTATEAAEMTRLKYEKRFLASFEDGFGEYYKRTGGSWMQAEKARAQYADAITAIVRGDPNLAREIPEAAKAVAEVRAIHKEMLELAQKHGVDGADQIDPDPFYIMRKLNHDRIRMIAGKYDPKAVKQLIAQAIRSQRGDIDEELLDKIAGGYWDTITRLPYRQELSDVAYGPKQFFTLRKELEGKLDDAVIDDVIEMLAGRTISKEGSHPRLKARTQMDELYSADVLTKNGQMEKLSIADLFINDSRLLMRQYSRQMSGLIGFARVGIKSEADWTKRLQEVLDEAAEKGQDSAKIQKHVGYLKDIRNYALGRPMADQAYGTTDRVLRVLRDVNFIRNMGQAGFAQVPEIGNLIGLAGMRAFQMHIPAFGDLFRHATAGRLDDELARDLLNMGLGAEHLSIKPNLREMDEWAFDRNLSKIEKLTEKGKYLTANVSGLAAMNDMLHTLASKAFTQKFVDYAHGVTPLNKAALARLNWAGIGEDNIDGIFARLKKHTTLGENGRVEGIDWEGWQAADPESFDVFNLAVFRESRKAIQQPTIGETAPWMHTQIGKILTQFRSFTLVAWAKQGMHNIHYADAATLAAWSLSTMFAGGAYVAQNYINYAHNPEQLRKRLAIEEVAKAAYQRSGFSSLTPGMIDTAMMFTRGEPLFAYGRTTGLGTGFIVGNPTMDLVSSKMLGTLQNASRSVFDDEHMWTRKDVKNGLGLFLPNYVGVRNFVDAASNEFPARNFLEQRDDR